jgi:hypothetical protein
MPYSAPANAKPFYPTIAAETKFGWNFDEIHQLLRAAGYECRPYRGDSILATPAP